MADPVTELRIAMVDQMRGYAPLTSVIGQRIYDLPPQQPAPKLPYVSLGPMNYVPDLVDCIEGGEIMIQVDVWSNEPGQHEAGVIAGLVRKSLDGFFPDLAVNALVEFNHWRTDHIVDGAFKHAAIRYMAIVEEH